MPTSPRQIRRTALPGKARRDARRGAAVSRIVVAAVVLSLHEGCSGALTLNRHVLLVKTPVL
jgi:hypothetical protein